MRFTMLTVERAVKAVTGNLNSDEPENKYAGPKQYRIKIIRVPGIIRLLDRDQGMQEILPIGALKEVPLKCIKLIFVE